MAMSFMLAGTMCFGLAACGENGGSGGADPSENGGLAEKVESYRGAEVTREQMENGWEELSKEDANFTVTLSFNFSHGKVELMPYSFEMPMNVTIAVDGRNLYEKGEPNFIWKEGDPEGKDAFAEMIGEIEKEIYLNRSGDAPAYYVKDENGGWKVESSEPYTPYSFINELCMFDVIGAGFPYPMSALNSNPEPAIEYDGEKGEYGYTRHASGYVDEYEITSKFDDEGRLVACRQTTVGQRNEYGFSVELSFYIEYGNAIVTLPI